MEKPPWLRPSASLAWATPPDSAVSAGAGGVLMRPDNCRIHEVQIPVHLAPRVGLCLQRRQDPVPEP